jgi:hypothetical protein
MTALKITSIILFSIVISCQTEALGTNAKSDVQVEDQDNSLKVHDLQKRSESLEKLKELGLILAMYASDHEEKYPDNLEEVKTYLSNEEDFQWIIENVDYRGRYKTKNADPNTVIAYDKTLLAYEQPTNVLFNDSHIESISQKKLRVFIFGADKAAKYEERFESAKKLSGLGKAMLIFASVHDEKYPDKLEDLTKADLTEKEIEWYKKNIEYLGDKVRLKDRPDAILAYDTTLLMQKDSQGTNVLYNDSHVSFEINKTLKKLGIESQRKTDVQVEGEVNSPGIEIRKVFLPNVEKEAVALDLATGELITISCEGEIDFQNESFVEALRNLKQGDLICGDGGFVCPQGARVKGSRHFKNGIAFPIYNIPRYLPCMTIVTTRRGRRYNLNVLEGSRGGYLLAYSQISSDIKRSPEPFLFEQLVSDKEFELAASANKLHNLCKAMLIYASDHDEKYPENLQLLTEAEVPESAIQWLRENIVYLGDKASPMSSPQAVLAYDKSILEDENNKGTNVLYNDCHVLYEKAEKLKKLGIAPKRKPDVPVEGKNR